MSLSLERGAKEMVWKPNADGCVTEPVRRGNVHGKRFLADLCSRESLGLSTTACGSPRLSTALHGSPRLSPALHGSPRLSPALLGSPLLSTALLGSPQLSPALHGSPRLSTVLHSSPSSLAHVGTVLASSCAMVLGCAPVCPPAPTPECGVSKDQVQSESAEASSTRRQLSGLGFFYLWWS